MCTVSIVPGSEGLVVSMNRDERRGRAEAPPLLLQGAENKLLGWYARDSSSGGSWFGVNQAGLLALLINRYQLAAPASPSQSRGVLVPRALQYGDAGAALRALAATRWPDFDGFELLLIQGAEGHRLCWDAANLQQESFSIDHPQLLLSSGVDYEAVRIWRQQAFSDFLARNPSPDVDSLLKLHTRRCPENPSLGILMEREHSHTKSICQAVLHDAQIRVRYLPVATLPDLGRHQLAWQYLGR